MFGCNTTGAGGLIARRDFEMERHY
jgi:hypothetical protein